MRVGRGTCSLGIGAQIQKTYAKPGRVRQSTIKTPASSSTESHCLHAGKSTGLGPLTVVKVASPLSEIPSFTTAPSMLDAVAKSATRTNHEQKAMDARRNRFHHPFTSKMLPVRCAILISADMDTSFDRFSRQSTIKTPASSSTESHCLHAGKSTGLGPLTVVKVASPLSEYQCALYWG